MPGDKNENKKPVFMLWMSCSDVNILLKSKSNALVFSDLVDQAGHCTNKQKLRVFGNH